MSKAGLAGETLSDAALPAAGRFRWLTGFKSKEGPQKISQNHHRPGVFRMD